MSGARGVQPAMGPITRGSGSALAFAAYQAIHAGDFDADLDTLARAIRARRALLGLPDRAALAGAPYCPNGCDVPDGFRCGSCVAGAAPAEPEPSSAELERMLTDDGPWSDANGDEITDVDPDGETIVRGER